ncbi:MAG TPA: cobalamin-binding protein [Casimicrobiaceae bacterium]
MNPSRSDIDRRSRRRACAAALALAIAWPAWAYAADHASSRAGSGVAVVDNSDRRVAVVDDSGQRVALARPAKRIVTLAPSATELVFAAGAGAHVVGVIKGSDYPPGARLLPVIGDVTALDLERIVALAPDLVVTWPWTTPSQVAWLRGHGVAVFEADPKQIAGIAGDIERLGTLTGTESVATAAAARFRGALAALERSVPGGPPLAVFYQVSAAPIFTLGGTQLVSEAIARCGGRNVFGSLSVPAAQVGIEAVLAAQPQAIVAGTDNAIRPAWLDDWRRWPELPAVRDGNLFVVDANLLHRPGPRFVEGMAGLCRALASARRKAGSRPDVAQRPKL